MNQVVVGLPPLSKIQNCRQADTGTPHEKKRNSALAKNKIQNGEGHENQKKINDLKTKDLELLIKAPADGYSSENQMMTPKYMP